MNSLFWDIHTQYVPDVSMELSPLVLRIPLFYTFQYVERKQKRYRDPTAQENIFTKYRCILFSDSDNGMPHFKHCGQQKIIQCPEPSPNKHAHKSLKKKYIEMFGSFTEPFTYHSITLQLMRPFYGHFYALWVTQ